MTTLSIVIPAYNEEKGIANIVQRVLAVRDSLNQVGVTLKELLVVDDGSRDKTAEIAGRIDGVSLIRHPQNKGYGAALKTGFGHANGQLIGFLDADGTYPPEHFPQLCQAALKGADLVVGSRMAGADSQMPLTRRVGNLFFAGLLSLITHQHITDSASGMRVFKREILEQVYPLPDGLNLTPVMSTRAIHEGIRVAEVAIPYSERIGRSKLSVVRDGSIFLRSMVWTALTYNPVRILGLIGLFGMAVAGLVGLGLLVLRLNGHTTLGPWAIFTVFTGAVAGFSGVSLFSLGITFNYLVSLFYKQPIRQGLFGRPLFKTPLDRQFWWLGGLLTLGGLGIGLAATFFGLQGLGIDRLWLYFLTSAMFILIGLQLIIYWVLLRVLDELSQREHLTKQDLQRL